ncbi:hypothetical protein DKX38_006313 [Salix brachista]|uniref:SNF2 N-terminal domain-containing protein n=1 Tax=Salix brachista TaxID=2182728 RepID=A0A5N5N585_9ROSI|nr:hypothetical protein DKX38_006313 [Salix brachista]
MIPPIETVLDEMDVKDGAKLKFFLNVLGLRQSTVEKLLVFSQYIPPLRLLERLWEKIKGMEPRKELFIITGVAFKNVVEWNDYCDDVFFESPGLREDLKVLYKRSVYLYSLHQVL